MNYPDDNDELGAPEPADEIPLGYESADVRAAALLNGDAIYLETTR